MQANIENTIKEVGAPYCDNRIHCFEVRVEKLEKNSLTLSGRVLERDYLTHLLEALSVRFPDLRLDTAGVRVLRGSDTPRLRVATNLTGLYDTPGFLNPLSSELLYGWEVEILEERERWGFTRQDDGYLGWAYLPYLSDQPLPAPTHLVMVPSVEVRIAPDPNAQPVTRLLSGAGVTVTDAHSDWVHISANQSGWVPSGCLRAITNIPASESQRRETIVRDAINMTGVPYLWGGCTGNGIDCSGLARLLHQWLGIVIPRDADMQCFAAKPVEPPFQPGDLLFFAEDRDARKITHVGISLGGWDIIHSSRSRNGVYRDNVLERQSLREIFASAGTFVSGC